MGSMLDVEMARCLKQVASRWGLKYLVLYGSRARGYAGPHSDYDIAVRAGRRLSLVERGLLYGDLEECTGARVDLLVVDDWDPIAVWEALARGVLVYTEDTVAYYWDLARAIDEVADMEHVIELFRRENKSALARTRS